MPQPYTRDPRRGNGVFFSDSVRERANILGAEDHCADAVQHVRERWRDASDRAERSLDVPFERRLEHEQDYRAEPSAVGGETAN